MKNYYSVLGVREDADQAEIKRAYRNLMRKWHPDVNRTQDATSRTEEVNHAFAVLRCPQSRYNHDIELKEAGLSFKPLFKKNTIPCLECGCKGKIKIYKKSLLNSVLKYIGFKTKYEEKLCLNCCGTGWYRNIKEW